MKQSERGISLVITFLIMAIMLAVVLSLSSMLFRQIKIMGSAADSISALYAAESGLERTLYIDQKQMPAGAARGLCNMCNLCSGANCQECTVNSLAQDGSNGCAIDRCTDCAVHYRIIFDGRQYEVDARVRNGALRVQSSGLYKEASRTVNYGN